MDAALSSNKEAQRIILTKKSMLRTGGASSETLNRAYATLRMLKNHNCL